MQGLELATFWFQAESRRLRYCVVIYPAAYLLSICDKLRITIKHTLFILFLSLLANCGASDICVWLEGGGRQSAPGDGEAVEGIQCSMGRGEEDDNSTHRSGQQGQCRALQRPPPPRPKSHLIMYLHWETRRLSEGVKSRAMLLHYPSLPEIQTTSKDRRTNYTFRKLVFILAFRVGSASVAEQFQSKVLYDVTTNSLSCLQSAATLLSVQLRAKKKAPKWS